MPSTVELNLSSGDLARYESQLASHLALLSWVKASGASYGLPSDLSQLDDVQRETLEAVYPNPDATDDDGALQIDPPASLALPPLVIVLSPSAGLKKTTQNFLALAADLPKFKSKRSPHPELSYRSDAGRKVFRVEQGFVAQMGDVTRGDGSGGESICAWAFVDGVARTYYGGAFNDDKEGLKTPFTQGTVAMANSGKNSNTSQFFITLSSTPAQLAKLGGKYVAFGQVDPAVPAHRETLERLSALANGKGGTTAPVWISACAVRDE